MDRIFGLQCRLYEISQKENAEKEHFEDFMGSEYQDVEWLSKHLTADEAAFLADNDNVFPAEDIENVRWSDGKTVIHNGKKFIAE